MPTTNWLPRAAKVAEVKTGAITAYDVATTYTMTRNGKTVSTIGTGGSVTTTAAALIALWNASTEPDLSEQTAANVAGSITLTMDTSGVPSGTCTLTVAGGTGTVTDFSTTTAATGPWHVDHVNNWSAGAVPTTEDVQVDLARGSMLYGAFAAGTLNSLLVFSSGTTQNTIGLPELNAAGYLEDRTKSFAKAATTATFEYDSPMVRWNYGAVANTSEVRKTGTGQNGVPSLLLAGTSASNVTEVNSGSVGLAYYADESYAGTILKLTENASVVQGVNGGTITTIDSFGALEINGAFTTLNQWSGSSVIEGTATPTVNVYGGTCDYRAGAPTALYVGNGGIIDANNDLTAITSTATTIARGGTLRDKRRRITHTSLLRGTDVEELSGGGAGGF